MSVIGDREAKKLEKLMAQEAKAEEKNIKHALKDVKKAERAVKKSVGHVAVVGADAELAVVDVV